MRTLLFLIGFIGFTTTPALKAYELPDLGHPSEQILTPGEESEMGRAFIQALRAQGAIYHDDLLSNYLQNLGQTLSTASPDQGRFFNFFLINSGEINAFAGPNATIGVNKGLILAAENESQLASVVAHEIAHVTQKHLTRAFQASEGASATTLATILAGILVGSSDPAAGAAIMFGGAAAGMQQQINFTRSNEQEADRVGIEILKNSQLNPKGMIEFFEILQQSSFYGSEDQIEFLRSHPLNTTRITEATQRVSQSTSFLPDNSLNFRLAHMRLRILEENNPAALLKDLDKKSKDSVQLYGRALILKRLQRYKEAISLLRELSNKKNSHLWYKLELADTYKSARNDKQALQILKTQFELYPTFKPVVHRYTSLLLDDKKTELAIKLLKEQLDYAEDIRTYELLSNAYAMSNNRLLAYMTRSQQYQMEGNLGLAAQQIKNALTLPGIEKQTIDKLKAQLERLKNEQRLLQ